MSDFVQLDHLCYRTVSLENYEQKKTELATIAQLLGETPIAGRSIATFRFNTPIRYDNWRIDAIELPAPKPNSNYKEGLEHIEFVLYDDLATFTEKYKTLPLETHIVNGINPAVGLQLGEYAVKFHLLSLPVVVYLEIEKDTVIA